jgi:ADP-ribosylglycohydrolase
MTTNRRVAGYIRATLPIISHPAPVELESRIRGCLVAGAVGDALGAAIEFDSTESIRRRVRLGTVRDFVPAYGHAAPITDDTQMTLFTAEGLIRAKVRLDNKGVCHAPSVVDHAYARWLATQGEHSGRWDEAEFDGWLLGVRGLHSRRAPGNTCISALHATRMGTIEEPLNDSKGCGGVMRIAPVGLMGRAYARDELFQLAAETAALTHGHPSGYLAAGALAEIVVSLCEARPLEIALDRAEAELVKHLRHEETLEALRAARTLADSNRSPGPETIALLGEGWVAEEALAIAVYCALVVDDIAAGLILAVNHGGDSDSTGAITGNILGALHGYDAIPGHWTSELEQRDTIEMICRDWINTFVREYDLTTPDVWKRYPGW